MTLVVLRPGPPSRRVAREAPRPAPPVALRRFELPARPDHPARVEAPRRPSREAPRAPLRSLPAPVLRLPGPPTPLPTRLTLQPYQPPPVPTLQEGVAAVASSVGILGGGGTRVVMVPADLTQPGRVDISDFRIALTAGVW